MRRRQKAGSLILALLMVFSGIPVGFMPSAVAGSTPPTDPTVIASPSHTIGGWSNETTISIEWIGGTDASSGVDGYSYSFTKDSTALPDTSIDTAPVDFNRPIIAGGGSGAVQDGFTVALKSDGTVAGVGANAFGQTTETASWTNIKAVAAGGVHALGLKTDGTVAAAGGNTAGQMNVSGWSDIAAVAAGEWHSLGLKLDGSVEATGANNGGSVAGTASWSGIKAVAAGFAHSVGLKTDGTVAAAGDNTYGQTTPTASWTNVKAIAVGKNHTVGLKNNGTVAATGNNTSGETSVSAWSGIVAIAAGNSHTVGLKSDGTVVAVGRNLEGQTNVSSWTDIKAIAAGDKHTIGLKSDGTVVAVGQNDIGQTNVAGLTNVRQPTYSAAYKVPSDGAWYFNLRTKDRAGNWTSTVNRGPYGVDTAAPADPTIIGSPSHTAGVWSSTTTIDMEWIGGNDGSSGVAGYSYSFTKGAAALPDQAVDTDTLDFKKMTIAAAGSHTVGLKSDGTVAAVGDNTYGQTTGTASWTDIKAIAAGGSHTVGLKTDGTVAAVGRGFEGQTGVSSWTGIKSIAGGGLHTVGLRSDGTVAAVGNNTNGQTTGTASWTDIKAIAAGNYHTVGLRTDGTVVAVGRNDFGQTGVSSWTGIVAIAAGGSHTVGLRSDGTVVAVGRNDFGQTAGTASWTDIKAIAAGALHTVGLKSDGTLVAVGNGGNGQTSVSSWTDIKAIAAGNVHTVGLKSNGGAVAVGDNTYGETTGTAGWADIRQPTYITGYQVPADGAWYFNLRTKDRAGNWTSTVNRGPFGVDTAAPADPTVVTSPSHTAGAWSTKTTIDMEWIGGNDNGSGVDGYSYSFTKGAAALPDTTTETVATNFNRPTIAAGWGHTVGLKSDGTVVAVGRNDNGQTTGAASWAGIKAIAAAENRTVGLKSDGTVAAVGYNDNGETTGTASWTDVKAIAAGGYHTIGLKTDGTVAAVGLDSSSQVSGTASWTDIKSIAAGLYHTVGHKSDGTVVAVGYNNYGQTTGTAVWTDIKAIAAGYAHTVGLKSNGTVVAVGYNGNGQTNVSGWSDIVAVAAAGYQTFGLKADGTVVGTGADGYGQVSGTASWTDIQAIAAGLYHTVGLKSDGTVVAAGYSADGRTNVSTWADFRQPTHTATYGVPSDGAWYFNLRTKDRFGRWTSTAYAGPFGVDTAAPADPAVTGSTPAKDAWTNSNVILVNFSGAADAGSGVDGFSIDWSGSPTTVPDAVKDLEESAASALSPPQPDGDRYFHLRTRDNSGKWTATIHYGPFKVDRTRPTASVRAPLSVTALGPTARFRVSWRGSDALSGVKNFDVAYKIGKRGKWRRWKSRVTARRAGLTGEAGKTYFFRARARDKAGNLGAWSSPKRTAIN